MHALIDNPGSKEQLLRVLLATNVGSTPVSLLHQCTLLLQQTTKLQSKVALLMLLAHWMSYCSPAVSAFLQVPGGVGYLVNQTCSNEHDDNEYLLQGLSAFLLAICIHFNDDSVESYTKDGLKQLLVKRIGVETFTAKLCEVSKHELYNKAAKHPQLRVKTAAEILIDYEFCRLFKVLESIIINSISVKQEIDPSMGEGRHLSAADKLKQYKNLIRQQDARLHELMHQRHGLIHQNDALKSALNDSIIGYANLKDKNLLLKAQLLAQLAGEAPIQTDQSTQTAPDQNTKASQATANPDTETNKLLEYEKHLQFLNSEVTRLTAELRSSEESKNNAEQELARLKQSQDDLKKDQDDLLELLADQDMKINEYKMRLTSLGQTVEDAKPDTELNLT